MAKKSSKKETDELFEVSKTSKKQKLKKKKKQLALKRKKSVKGFFVFLLVLALLVGVTLGVRWLLFEPAKMRTNAMSAAQRKKEEKRREAALLAGEAVPDPKPEGDLSLFFVDLPGYGYAKASAQAKEQWGKLIERYLKTSPALRTVFLLVDIRHAPGENDRVMVDWIMRSGFEPVVIATKADKVKKSEMQKNLKLIRSGLKVNPGTVVIPFSAVTRQGRDEIWQYLADMNAGLTREA